MRLMFLSDIHTMLTNPVAWVSDYPKEMKKTLHWIKRLSKKLKIDEIICAGDIFHKDTLRRPSLIVRSIVYAIIYLPDMWGIVGNHDLVGNTMENLGKSMIAPIIAVKKYNQLQKPSMFGNVGIYGFNYGEDITIPDDDAKFRIAVWHQLITNDDTTYPGSISAKDVLDKWGDYYDLFITGDNHQSFTVIGNEGHRAKGLINPGSLMRMTASQMEYNPVIYMYDTETNLVTTHPVPTETWEMTREHLVVDDVKEERFAVLARTIQENDSVSISFVENMRKHIKTVEIDKEVSEMINESMGEIL